MLVSSHRDIIHSTASDLLGRCASFGLFIVLALFLMSLSGDASAQEDGTSMEHLHSAQAHLATHANTTKAPNHSASDRFQPTYENTESSGSMSGGAGGLRGRNGDTEQDMSDMVDGTLDELKEAEVEEVKKEKGMISSTLGTIGSGIRSSVSRLFGASEDSEEVNQIVAEIESKLEENATATLQLKADEIEEDEEEDIERNVELEEERGDDIEDIENNLVSHKGAAVSHVKAEIDQSAEEIQKNLRYQAAMMEKEMMEKRLSARLGYQVKLQITNNEVDFLPQQQQPGGYQQQPPQGGYQQQPYYPPQQGGQQYYPPPQGGQQYYPPQQGGQYYPPQGGQQGGYAPSNPGTNNGYSPQGGGAANPQVGGGSAPGTGFGQPGGSDVTGGN